jgi:Bacterial PH domain
VPLSILTSDSAGNEQSQGYALPHTAQDQWSRPYRPGPVRVAGAALLLMLSSYLMFAALIIGLSGAISGAGAILAAAVLLVVATVRLLHTGVWVSSRGLRLVRLLRTTTLRWSHVAQVRTSQQPVRWLGLPRTVQGQALLLVRAGRTEPGILFTDHNADFLGRVEAFDKAADAIEDWATPGR